MEDKIFACIPFTYTRDEKLVFEYDDENNRVPTLKKCSWFKHNTVISDNTFFNVFESTPNDYNYLDTIYMTNKLWLVIETPYNFALDMWSSKPPIIPRVSDDEFCCELRHNPKISMRGFLYINLNSIELDKIMYRAIDFDHWEVQMCCNNSLFKLREDMLAYLHALKDTIPGLRYNCGYPLKRDSVSPKYLKIDDFLKYFDFEWDTSDVNIICCGMTGGLAFICMSFVRFKKLIMGNEDTMIRPHTTGDEADITKLTMIHTELVRNVPEPEVEVPTYDYPN